jgi:hypothetical protein
MALKSCKTQSLVVEIQIAQEATFSKALKTYGYYMAALKMRNHYYYQIDLSMLTYKAYTTQ